MSPLRSTQKPRAQSCNRLQETCCSYCWPNSPWCGAELLLRSWRNNYYNEKALFPSCKRGEGQTSTSNTCNQWEKPATSVRKNKYKHQLKRQSHTCSLHPKHQATNSQLCSLPSLVSLLFFLCLNGCHLFSTAGCHHVLQYLSESTAQ